jgi:hypothetical protein
MQSNILKTIPSLGEIFRLHLPFSLRSFMAPHIFRPWIWKRKFFRNVAGVLGDYSASYLSYRRENLQSYTALPNGEANILIGVLSGWRSIPTPASEMNRTKHPPVFPTDPTSHDTWCYQEDLYILPSVRFEVFTTVTMKNDVFWDVTPCGSCISSQRASVASYSYSCS